MSNCTELKIKLLLVSSLTVGFLTIDMPKAHSFDFTLFEDDRTGWENAVVNLEEETFESYTGGGDIDIVPGGVTVLAGGNSLQFTINASYDNTNGSSSNNLADNLLDDSANGLYEIPAQNQHRSVNGSTYVMGAQPVGETWMIEFDTPIQAFGWEYASIASGVEWDVETASGVTETVQVPQNSNHYPGDPKFFGVVNADNDAFTKIHLRSTDGGFGVDNFVFAEEAVPFKFSTGLATKCFLALMGCFRVIKQLKQHSKS